jgi:prevent-host-death family protein
MTIQMIPASDLRKHLHRILDALDRPLYITAHGRAKAVLIDIEAYDRMVERMEDLADACDPEVARALSEAKAAPREELVPLREVLERYGLQRTADDERK